MIYLVCDVMELSTGTRYVPESWYASEPAARERCRHQRMSGGCDVAVLEWHGDAPEMDKRLRSWQLEDNEARRVM